MKLTIAHDALNKALSVVSRAVASRAVIPMLTGIRLSADKGLKVRATDMSLAIETSVECAVSEPGTIILPAKSLLELVKRIPPGDVTLTTNDKNHTATVTWGESKYTVHGWSAEQFPAPPAMVEAVSLTINNADLSSLIRRSVFAADVVDGKPHMDSINLTLKTDALSSVGASGLQIATVTLPIDSQDTFNVIIPSHTCNELLRLLPRDGAVTVMVSYNYAAFTFGAVTVGSRLLDGVYPDVRRLLPTSFTATVVIPKDNLIEAIERVCAVIDDQLTLATDGNSLVLSNEKPEMGVASERVPATATGDVKVCLNGRALAEYLKVVDEPKVILSFVSAKQPVKVTPVGNTTFVYVQAPMIPKVGG